MCRFKGLGPKARSLGTSREEHTNPTLPPKKTQEEKEVGKSINFENKQRRGRRKKATQKEIQQQAAEKSLAHLIEQQQIGRTLTSPQT